MNWAKLFRNVLIASISMGVVMAAWEYPGEVTIIGSEETVFDHSADACETINIPDAPTRAFRDADNNIQLLVGHYETYRMIGPDFDNLSLDCANGSVLVLDHDPDPANYNDNEWIGSTYTEDGATIYAVIHNEYHGVDHPGGCDTNDPFECWYNAITFGVSTDSGRTYSHATAPDHLLASVPYTWNGSGPYGLFEPSNIVHNPNDNYYYMFITANAGHGLQETGVGLVRTLDFTDPTSWRGWDGEAFTVELINPYTASGFDPADHVLARIDQNLNTYGNMEKMHYSLSYSTYYQKFILVDSAQLSGVWGFYYSLSDDLLHWTPRILIREANVNINLNGSTSGLSESYPTLIDHDDTSRNFSNIGQTPYLYWSRWDQDAVSDYERDLMRVQISFDKVYMDGLTVTVRGDAEDINGGDGNCLTGLGDCTLRAALQESARRPHWYNDSLLVIDFEIGTASRTIYVNSPLDRLYFPVVLDGTTQAEHVANSNDFADGINATYAVWLSGDYADLEVRANNTVIKGLEIDGTVVLLSDNNILTGNSIGRIEIDSSANNTLGGSSNAERNRIGSIRMTGPDANDNWIEGNYIGTDLNGSASAESEFSGVNIGSGAHNNTVLNNLISGTGFAGIEIGPNPGEADNNTVEGNVIGLDRTASLVLANPASGIKVGGTDGTIIRDNIISGNDGEAGIFASDINNTVIQGNIIGSNPEGDSLGNTEIGLWLFGESNNNLIGGTEAGDGNVIAFSGTHGIDLGVYWGENTTILGNSIYGNAQNGIQTPGEWDYSAPTFSMAFSAADQLEMTGELNGRPDSTYRIEFFSSDECDPSGTGEGQTYLGFTDVMTGAAGSVSFTHSIAGSFPSGTIVTATSTDEDGNTSGFSECITSFDASEAPVLLVSADTLTYTYYPDDSPVSTENIELVNDGVADLEWSSSTTAGWIFLEPSSGSLAAGDTVVSGITVYAIDTPDGIYHESVSIHSNDPLYPEHIINITIHNGVGGVPLIEITPDTLRMTVDAGPDVMSSFTIHNVGESEDNLNWTAGMTGLSWIFGISPTTGSTAAGTSSEVEFGIRPQNLSPGLNTGFLWVSSNAANINVVEIQMEITLGGGTNTAPTALSQQIEINEDEDIEVMMDGSDPEMDFLTFMVTSEPFSGFLEYMPDGAMFYRPDTNFFGADSFQFTANDGEFDSEPGWVWIDVAPVNDPPTPFELLSPENDSTIVLTWDNPFGTFNFRWSSSSDVDSPVYYHIESSGLNGFSREPQTDTSFVVANMDFQAQMDSTHAQLVWNIIATDSLEQIVAVNGPFILNLIDSTTVSIRGSIIPEDYALRANYPNPFNPSTSIGFDIPKAGQVRVEIVDLSGRQVAVLINDHYDAGSYEVVWSAVNLQGDPVSAGVYFYRLVAGNHSMARKMILLK
ncbi:MAG: right-handed parallel beta-helix repeat-containing protein [FCB group bacterium]|nr:right-handed parallel beta-helix repeat-containing protein [FCB group bacterium]MBL7028259.1 right-handed parallel beta-helix repeat-containing protein [Candidatus Neomarinimicrobiota bacterium]